MIKTTCAAKIGAYRAKRVNLICRSARAQNDLKIRKGRQDDINLIRTMVIRERMNPLTLDPLRFIVAEKDDTKKLAGCVQLADLQNNKKELRTLIVEPDFRGQGVGQILVQEILKDVGECQVYIVTLLSTQPFYEKFDFNTIGLSDLPTDLWMLWIEFLLGTVVARVVANDKLIIMRKTIQ
eukprot:TRINITY_DN10315_c1_g1_i1.p1 TRINITY_DN10315_c1_g1~~TRINITY_DN10315_c1_g1_i1.p1  ORF type:complete len:181 (+),score=17.46 TRINITY_DN10315_c1_g1_i1:158-700(+)